MVNTKNVDKEVYGIHSFVLDPGETAVDCGETGGSFTIKIQLNIYAATHPTPSMNLSTMACRFRAPKTAKFISARSAA